MSALSPPEAVLRSTRRTRVLVAGALLLAPVLIPAAPTVGLLVWAVGTALAIPATAGTGARPAMAGVVVGYPIVVGVLALTVSVGLLPAPAEVAALVVLVAVAQAALLVRAVRRL